MPVTSYNTVEEISRCDIAGQSYTWPTYNGCSGRVTYYGHTYYLPPVSTPTLYDSGDEVITRMVDKHKGLRKGYPPFVFTPWHVSRIKTTNHLLRRRNGTNLYTIAYQQYGHVANPGTGCVAYLERTESDGPELTEWYDVTHYDNSPSYTVNSIREADIEDAKRRVMDNVSLEALTSYDVLTDIAEAREIPQLVQSVTSDLLQILRTLRGRYNINDLRAVSRWPIKKLLRHAKKAYRKLGDEWMAYRYGIMPLVYSYRDINKLLDRGQSTITRKSETVSAAPTGVTLPGSTSQYRWVDTSGNVVVRGTVFQNFTWERLAQLAGLGVNPLTTAWELIPYSFVIDWFVNMGDYITRSTSLPLSRLNWACISQRSKYSVRTWVHYKKDDKVFNCSVLKCTPWMGANPPTPPPRTVQRPEESQLLQEVEYDEYRRSLFPLSGAQLTINPNLNWRRMVDSAVIANNLLRSCIKAFKG